MYLNYIRFGGEAEDCTEFWPPKSPSNEYGVDPDKICEIEESEGMLMDWLYIW